MEVLKVIASGGFGRVEQVRLDDGSIGARKTFAPRDDLTVGVDLTKLRKRFAREVRVQSALPDTLFIPVLRSDLNADPPWFVMPMAEFTLDEFMPALHADQRESLEALGHILDALEHLHSLGYVHRDLKPSNIMMHGKRWKLSDFGLVLPMTSKSTKLSTKLSSWGTAGYCAPEQCLEFGSVTQAADIFAFGCILHDMFDGRARVPFQRATCGGPIGAVIERCTEVDPRRRFKTLSGLRASLFDVLATPPTVVGTSQNPEAAELASKLENVQAMTSGDISTLVRFLRGIGDASDATAIFTALNEERLVALKERDSDAWNELAMRYCEWSQGGGFNFEYCDVIVGRLKVIFELGPVEMKAAAALAGAKLGWMHNRYYVMHRVLEMCGPALDDNVAQRIAVEIRASEVNEEFRACAYVVGRRVAEYHPRIAAVLPDPAPVATKDETDIPV